jgi:hypothetical protein
MLNRKNLVVAVALVLMVSMLAGCAAGGASLARDPEISSDAAMSAQNKAIAGLGSGQVEWTEAEFSSLLTLLVQQNLGSDMISGIKANFDPSGLTLAVGTPMGEAVLKGNIMVEDNILKVNLDEASAMGMAAVGPILDVVEGAINRALNDQSLGVAVGVEMGDGTLALSLQ